MQVKEKNIRKEQDGEEIELLLSQAVDLNDYFFKTKIV
jgi:hypothetical protein